MEAGITVGRGDFPEAEFNVALFVTKPNLGFLSLEWGSDWMWEEGEWLKEEYTIGPKCLIAW